MALHFLFVCDFREIHVMSGHFSNYSEELRRFPLKRRAFRISLSSDLYAGQA